MKRMTAVALIAGLAGGVAGAAISASLASQPDRSDGVSRLDERRAAEWRDGAFGELMLHWRRINELDARLTALSSDATKTSKTLANLAEETTANFETLYKRINEKRGN